jgi:hypothetical protein
MALFNDTAPFDWLFNRWIDPAFWGAAPVPEAARAFRGWVYGAWGAMVAGWGITIAFLARHPFARRRPWARTALLAGLGYWFVLDSGVSLAFGVWFNAAAVNLPLLVLLLLPLWATRRAFPGQGDG